MKDDLGDRMKLYEHSTTSQSFINVHQFPVYARVDGRVFHSFCRGRKKPFDPYITMAMLETTVQLCKQLRPILAYTQSDEISLIWLTAGEDSQMIFDGNWQKLTSVVASLTTAIFSTQLYQNDRNKYPHFDCRVFQLPSKMEAVNALVWRSNDAERNAVQAIAQSLFSHQDLQGKNIQDQLDMIGRSGYDKVPNNLKYGTIVRPRKKEGDIRTKYTEEPLTVPIRSLENKVEFVFEGAAPLVRQQ